MKVDLKNAFFPELHQRARANFRGVPGSEARRMRLILQNELQEERKEETPKG